MVRSVLRNNPAIYNGYHLFRLFSRLKGKDAYLLHEAELRRFDQYDLERLSKVALKHIFWEREIFRCNEIYSHDLVIKRYLDMDYGKPLPVLIEHGCVYLQLLVETHLTYPSAKHNVVMSRARSEFLRTKGVKSVPIGPYIHYAESFFNDRDMAQIKRQLGKTLLFFPSHSTLDISIEDSYNEINGILSALKDDHSFDTIIICGYFMDIAKGLFNVLEKKKGYHFVSCGHRLGPAFLQLLKSYLLLADVVASNTLGTQAGYSLYYGKPFWVVSSKGIMSYYKGDSSKIAEEVAGNEQPVIGTADLSFVDFENMFRSQEYAPGGKVLEMVRQLWGFDDVLSKEHLYQAVFR